MKRSIITIAAAIFATVPAVAQENTAVENNEPDVAPNTMSVQAGESPVLRVGVQKSEIVGGAEADANASEPLPGYAQSQPIAVPSDNPPKRLSARASADPDRDNAELMLAWDKWRNRFAHAVWQRYCQTLDGAGTVFVGPIPVKLVNTPSYHFPEGLAATYACGITADHRMTYAHITSSSGVPELDRIILDAVVSMAGKHSIAFPKGSQRQFVTEIESLGTGPSGWHGRQYGDVERISQRPQ